ncbi:MAG TPA: hypothetical protein VFJ16_18180 [Longimicrobium sp.]|nr:hypothetical protein [Longimicrobium sp.]
MRIPLLTRSAVVLLALAAAACADDRAPTTTPPPNPEAPKPPRVVGLYEITITGIGTDQATTTVTPMRSPTASGVSPTLTPITSGLSLEQVSTSAFTEGTRTGGGQRYLTTALRVRNGTAAALNNLTFMMVTTASSINGTPLSVIRKFDNTNADPSIAPQIAPTGVTVLGSDQVTMQSPYPDVLQVFTEAEVAAITPPAGVTGVFPYGYVVRNKNTNANRTLPSAAANANQYDGVFTVAFRVPLQASAAADVFTLTFLAMAVEDTETRMTESIEESQDTGAVRRLRDRATTLGATTVTVLNGSPVLDPAVPDYPGQRQVCNPRTAGTAASPVNYINTPGAYSTLAILMPGESFDPCAAYFRTGTPDRPATNVPFNVIVKGMDRYGNLKVGQVDSLTLSETNGVPAVMGPSGSLSFGIDTLVATYTNYGSSILKVQGKRLEGRRPVPVAGVKRTWTAGAGTFNWQTNGNWSPAAVPMQLDTAIVPVAAPMYPILSASVQIGGVQVENNAFIRLEAFDMTASSDVTAGLTGGIQNTSGRLFLSGIAHTVEGKVPALRVTGTYSLTANVNARAPIQVDAGRLTVSALRLQADSN